ncbi:TRAP transporter substrate-binding protein [Ammoniphilus sp. YIM 78166]|uniref:TRAP transporter substrate-binding protein n=1 Tax=Ammoniphilus sp. YIM 78166 TaxID=1644106 RepID=UPI00106FD9BA|nr:TRAP transporter substrate-binding protein [Ammoniphilus sp. YIM 78166]
MKILKSNRTGLISACLSLMLVLTACGSGTEPSNTAGSSGDEYKFKLTHITQPSHVWHKTAEKFAEELNTRSDGRMTVEIYAAGQLGPEKDMVQQLETGALDFGIITNGYMSTRLESLNAWFMPFVFDNLEEATKARTTEPAKEMLKELDKQGLVGMDFMFAGNRHILMKQSNVLTPEDAKGKKVRILGSPAIQDFWTALGAGPTPMPLPEVYTSLQTGVIDGIDIDLDALATEKYYENAKYLTLSNHMTFPAVVVMSKASQSKLSAEDQTLVNEAMKAAVDWGVQEAVARESKNLEELKKMGIEIKEVSDRSAFSQVKEDIQKKYAEKDPLIKSFLETTKK